MPWAAVGAAASVGSGIANYIANSSANDRAASLQNQSLQNWLNVNIPDPKEQQIALKQYVQTGQLAPKLQSAIAQDPSAFQKIAQNTTYQNAQNKALSQLEDIGNSGGLRLQDKAALQDALLNSQVQERANRQGVAAEMARRGIGNSGFGVAAQLQGQQGVSDQLAKNSLGVAAQAQNRALQSIEDAGNMGTQMRGENFNEQAQKASAADRINQFNTQNLRDVNAANIMAQNQAQQYNLNNQQNISNMNTDLFNKQQAYNKNLMQQNYENQVQKAQGMSGQYQNLANNAQYQGQILGNTISNIGSGLAGAASAQQNSDFWDEYFKSKKPPIPPAPTAPGTVH